MSFKATLKIGGDKFDVLSCSFGFSQGTDAKGLPATGVSSSSVSLAVESAEASQDEKLLALMIDSRKVFDASITMERINDDSTYKEIKLERCYMIGYSEGFTAQASDHNTINVTITFQKMTIGNVTHDNEWPVKV
jgi:hypothetical protein